MKSILNQLKKRRLELGVKQSDMYLRTGISRQQYNRLEAQGNPRMETLELIAKGLEAELVLIPRENYDAVMNLINSTRLGDSNSLFTSHENYEIDDPWAGLLDDAP